MTKNEYLQKLSDALIADEESKQAVFRFYEELIEDRQECGMSEEEAVADMERIEDLAGRLNDEFSAIVAEAKPDETAEKAGEAAPKKPLVNLPFEIDTDELGRMGKDALKAAKGLFKDAVKGFNKAVDGVTDFFKGNAAAGAPEEAEVPDEVTESADAALEIADEVIEIAEEEAERLSEAAEEAEEEAARLAEEAEKLAEAAEADRLAEEAAEAEAAEADRLAEEAAEAEAAEADRLVEEAEKAAKAAGEEKKTGEEDPVEQLREFAEKLNEKVTAATGAAGGILRQMAEGLSKLVSEAAEKAQKAAEEAEKAAGDDAEPAAKAVEETAAPVEKAAEEADAEPAEKTVEPDQHAPLRAPWVTPPEMFEDGGQEETADSAPEQNENPNAYKKMEFTCEPEEIRAAMLNAGDFPIRVAPSGDSKVHLTYYTHPKDEYTAGVENGVLTLNHLGKRRVRAAFSFSINLLLFKFNVSNGKAFEEITLLLPPVFDGDLTVRNSNARVGVEGLFNLSKVDVRTSNASVGLTGLKANEIIAASSNGRVVGDSVECAADLKLSTSNSTLRANNVKCGGRLVLTTSNGSVEMVDVIADAVHAATSNAAIRVDHIAAGSYELSTSNGSVSGVMPGKMEDYAISSHTSNGKNSLPENTFGAIPFKVRTSNGAIRIAFAGDASV